VSAAVEQVLDRRGRQTSGRPAALALGAAAFVHALALAAALLLPRLSPPPEPIEFVPVTILPAQALGVPRPAPPRPAPPTPPAPEPAAPTPPPEVREPEPEPEPPPREEAPVLPERKPERKEPKPEPRAPRPVPAPATPQSRPTRPQTPTPPTQAPSTETGDQTGRRGGATGTALGTTAFGARLPGIDPDFTYGYYIDRLLSAIDGNWVRPRVDGSVRTIVSFRIGRDGSLSSPPTVKESSGYNAFDLAALRAVQNAAPFPPLPRGYRNDSLNVNLIVR
jgi:TonB family protein